MGWSGAAIQLAPGNLADISAPDGYQKKTPTRASKLLLTLPWNIISK